jgi:uncharacterized damage-inducible protein DinB
MSTASLDALDHLITYGDWANDQILAAAATVSDEQLDRPLEIGPGTGTLRRIIAHTWAGEFMWLNRWQGRIDLPWPREGDPWPIAEIAGKLRALRPERDAFLAKLDHAALVKVQPYRDSKGGQYEAALLDMILQQITHSTHHRAQAVNALRRLGGPKLEVDYMIRIRRAK